jgi:AraC-like DNA-binding protein
MTEPLANDLRAIVRPSVALDHFTLENWTADPPLDRFVIRFWKTKWNLPDPFVQTIVTHPVVNLVFQADGTAIVTGVHRSNMDRHLVGSGWAFGVMFRCGGFRPFLATSLDSITEKRIAASEIFGASIDSVTRGVLTASTDEERVKLVHTFLIARTPLERTVGEDLSDQIELIATENVDPTRVEDLAHQLGVSTRTLQRLFREHVGVSPKWVLDRVRLHATAERTLKPVKSWADVAQELGYSDQAHLTSTFNDTYGVPPATYARLENTKWTRS